MLRDRCHGVGKCLAPSLGSERNKASGSLHQQRRQDAQDKFHVQGSGGVADFECHKSSRAAAAGGERGDITGPRWLVEGRENGLLVSGARRPKAAITCRSVRADK